MLDLLYLAATVAFFALMLAYVRGCAALGGSAGGAVDGGRSEGAPDGARDGSRDGAIPR